MKITNVVCYVSRTLLVKVETDEGVFGFGQCSGMSIPVICEIIQRNIKPLIIGMDPFAIEKIEDMIIKKNYKVSGQMLAIAFSGIEIALWDLKGKYLNTPIYNLLGGKFRDKIDMYGSSMSRDLTDDEESEKISQAIDEYGFKAVKIKIGPRYGNVNGVIDLDKDVKKIKRIRETIGKQCKLIIDANSSYTYFQAIELFERTKEYDISIFEEPCPYYDLNTYLELIKKLPIPINWGEQDWNIYTFRDFISKGAVQYCAVDVTKCGGLLRAKRIAALCHAYGILLSPHDTSLGIGMAAHIQLLSSCQEANTFQEYNIEPNLDHDYLVQPFKPIDGSIKVSDEPGLGVELDYELIESVMQVIE